VAIARSKVETVTVGDAALVTISGSIDERFAGFGDLASYSTVVLDVAKVARMSSFGVAQWLRAMEAVPPNVAYLYLAGCPPVFVDQLNMILKFAGRSKVVSLMAPYACPSCSAEYEEPIDVLAHGHEIVQGVMPERACGRCNGRLEFDEIVASYVACVSRHGASSIAPAAAQLIASHPPTRLLRSATPQASISAASAANVVKLAPKPRREIVLDDVESESTRSFSKFWMIAVVIITLVLGAIVYVLIRPH
jgi:anti-anti-sigma regulatory factor